MNSLIDHNEKLAALCAESRVDPAFQPLLKGLAQIYPDLNFKPVLTRGGWYRLGGVVDAGYQRITDNITHWAEQESGGDVESLVVEYMDKTFFATRLAGKTHYFNAQIGDGAEDFIQLEIEELQEVLDRPLVDADWFPESIEEFLDPIDYPRLEPEPMDKPYYLFRRITSIHQLVHENANETRLLNNIKHFFADWGQSSAVEGGFFSDHWILALREYIDSDGQANINAKPVCAFADKLPGLPDGDSLSGAALAHAIHDFDRHLGYPFSWFFMMLSSKADNFHLADAVLRDQAGAYDYLPARDLRVLREWEASPYSV